MISDIPGVSGRAMLRAIIAGERDPRVLAELARGRMRSKTKKLEEALDCEFFTGDHAFILEMMLEEIDSTTARIAVLDEKIAVMCEPYERQVAQLNAVPGFGVTVAQDLIAGIGVDMTVFPSAGNLSSWLRTAPGVKESAGRRKGKNATCRGSPYAGGALGEAAVSAGLYRYLPGAKYRRMCKRMPKKKALGALMRTQVVIAYHLLPDPEAKYGEPGAGLRGAPGRYRPAGPQSHPQPRTPRLPRPGQPRRSCDRRDPHARSGLTAKPSPGAARREADGTNHRRQLPPARLR